MGVAGGGCAGSWKLGELRLLVGALGAAREGAAQSGVVVQSRMSWMRTGWRESHR
jgi:hypothetical protein